MNVELRYLNQLNQWINFVESNNQLLAQQLEISRSRASSRVSSRASSRATSRDTSARASPYAPRASQNSGPTAPFRNSGPMASSGKIYGYDLIQ
jgi:hypothetical protein